MKNNALVIEGGGMRGIFAAGVLDYFMDKEIYFPNVIGVSAGACHGCSYVCGQRGRAYATSTDYLEDSRYFSLKNLLKTGDMFGSDFIYGEIPKYLYPIDQAEKNRLGIKFQTVVTNCITGKAEYPVVDDLIKEMDYVRASASLPIISKMVPIEGYVYLDGGIADSIPVKHCFEEGNEKVVVILTRPIGYRKKIKRRILPAIKAKYSRYPNLVKAIAERNKVYNETLDYIDKVRKEGRLFIISPIGSLDIGRVEMDRIKLKKAYEEGYFVAEGLEQKLRTFLEE